MLVLIDMGLRQNPPHPVRHKGLSLDAHHRCISDARPIHTRCIPDVYPNANAVITFTERAYWRTPISPVCCNRRHSNEYLPQFLTFNLTSITRTSEDDVHLPLAANDQGSPARLKTDQCGAPSRKLRSQHPAALSILLELSRSGTVHGYAAVQLSIFLQMSSVSVSAPASKSVHPSPCISSSLLICTSLSLSPSRGIYYHGST